MGATNAFIGRAPDLKRLATAIDESRLVTLLGPGGVGKTRLARELVAARAGLFCDLSEARDVSQACNAVARLLDLPLSRDEASGVEQLGHALAAREPALVVLDNFEQLPPEAAEMVATWLDIAGSARLLVTSRQRLQIAGEHVVVLDPLPREDATKLFAARARAAGADVAGGEAVVADIVELLDRVPLAIELAAARARLLPPPQLCARLKEGLSALGAGPRDAAPRQKTLTASIAWSWDLLDADEQRALAQCAVFAGGFSAAAACAVLDAAEPLDVLQRLCDKSLVVVEATRFGQGVFRLLGAVRAYASERVPIDDATRARYWRFVAGVAAKWLDDIDRRTFDAEPKALHEALRAQESLLMAIDFAREAREPDAYDAVATIVTAFVSIVARAGPLAPHLPLLDAILSDDRMAALSTVQRVRLILCRAQVRRLCGRHDGALEDAERAVQLCDEPRMGARARWVQGLVHADRAELSEAKGQLEAALPEVKEHDVPAAVGALLVDMAGVVWRDGDRAAAVQLVDRALPILRVAGAKRDVARALELRGVLAIGDEATAALGEALAVFREIGDRRREASCARDLATALRVQGRFAEARAQLVVAERKSSELGDRLRQMHAVAMRGVLAHIEGDLSSALELHRHASAGYADLGDERMATLCASRAAAALADRGEIDLAASEVAVPLHRAHLDVARGDHEAARQRRDEVQHATLEDLALFDSLLPPRDALGVGPDARWVVLPGGARVALDKKEALRRIVAGLVEARRRTPGRVLSRAELFAFGWPQERALLKAQGTRVRVALSTLRKMGLRELIVSRDDGWLLDPRVDVLTAR